MYRHSRLITCRGRGHGRHSAGQQTLRQQAKTKAAKGKTCLTGIPGNGRASMLLLNLVATQRVAINCDGHADVVLKSTWGAARRG